MNRLTIAGIILLVSVFTVGCNDPNVPSQINPASTGGGQQALQTGPPSDINISLRLCPASPDLSVGIGSYVSGGLIEDQGNANSLVAVHGPDASTVKLVEGLMVLESEVVDGTITFRFQLQGNGDLEFPVVGAVEGTWAILSGTGVYENLHGQGTARTEVVVDLSNECGVPGGVILTSEFTGKAHFDNQN